MKSKIAALCIAFVLNVLSVYAGDVNGVVVCSEGNIPVQDAKVQIFRADSLIVAVATDAGGRFGASLPEGAYRIQVAKDEYLPLEDSLIVTAADRQRELRLMLDKEPINLGEVIVKASPIYIKNLEDGIVYNLSKDKYAQDDNLLNALNRIPLVTVDNDGAINVAGKNSYVVYVNGKPYPIANAAPAQVLRSIPSSTIKQVEVVTRPGNRFGESAPVINIITKGKALEGYHINVHGMGATTPKATGAASMLGIVRNVQFFAGYTYELWGQRDQEWRYKYDFGNGRSAATSSDRNRYYRHTHLGRAMLQWDMDTLSQLYADIHVNGINRDRKEDYSSFGFRF